MGTGLYGGNGFTVGGGTNPDGTQRPGTQMMSVGGPYGPVIRVPDWEANLFRRLGNRRAPAAPAQPAPAPVNTIMGGRETAAPTTTGTPGTPTTTSDATGAFASILRLLQAAASGA